MNTVVFLGPSLHVDTARAHLDAEFLPPARMGDIYRAVERGVQVIALIDGLFEQIPAVWHKEVLFAIDRGVAVFGGSSMGALRAAELHTFGMQGIGRIFEDFASGRLEDDDEVAVLHGSTDDGYASHSEAMVNLRYGLQAAHQAGLIDSGQLATLLGHAKAQFYPERCWQSVFACARRMDAGIGARLAEFIGRVAPNQKRDDALAVLEAVRIWTEQGRSPNACSFHFEHTRYWENVVSHFGEARSASSSTTTYVDRVNTHIRLADSDRTRLLERALLLSLADAEARRVGLVDADLDQRRSMETFRRARQLNSPEQLAQWMAANDLDQAECLELARLESQLQLVGRRKAAQVDGYLIQTLKLAGRYPEVATYTASKWNSSYVKESRALLSNDESTVAQAFEWYQDQFGTIVGDLSDYAAGLRLTESEFLEEILVEFLYRRYLQSDSGNMNDTALTT